MSKMDEVIKAMNKKAKEEIVTVGLSDYHYTRIPFTSPMMNYCTFGGIPLGILAEFFGEEHGGKTTTALDIVANFQRMFPERGVLYCDCENTLDVEWARKLGVDVESMFILQPKAQSAEEIFQFICESVETGEIGLFVLDSIGAMVSQQELDKDMEEKTYGGVSKPLTLFGKKIEMSLKKNNATGIGINQIRQIIGSTYGGTTTPGGNAWKHFCAIRMEFRRGPFIDEKGNNLTRSAATPCGNIVQVSLTKSKTCPPTRRVASYTLNYATGIDYVADLVEVAIRYDIVDKHGAWYDIVDPDTGEIIQDKLQGQASLFQYLRDNPEICDYVERLVNSKMNLA